MPNYNKQITNVIFVDLRNTTIGHKFGFWETTTESFVSICGSYAWNTYAEFEENCDSCNRVAKHKQKYNYKHLCPGWVHVCDSTYNQHPVQINPDPDLVHYIKKL